MEHGRHTLAEHHQTDGRAAFAVHAVVRQVVIHGEALNIRALPDGYDTKLEQGGTNVSGGQKQRLCIARALLKNPKILILDDSTSAVDTHTDALIRGAFRNELPHVTKLIIAQRVASVEDADRVIVLDGGRVAAFDTPENLMKTNKIYQEVAASQKKGGE